MSTPMSPPASQPAPGVTATPAATPTEVFHRLVATFSSGRWADAAALYAPDAVAELPFALPAPDRVEGRETLHQRFSALAAGNLDITVENIRVHTTADPEVIVAEFDYRGRAVATGRDFSVANIQVLRIRDGLITATRDYHDHVALAVATGHLPALDDALGGLDLDRVRG